MSDENPQPAVMSVKNTSDYLDVSPETVRRMVKNGDLPHVRVGNSIRIRRVDIDAFLESRTTRIWERVDKRGQSKAS